VVVLLGVTFTQQITAEMGSCVKKIHAAFFLRGALIVLGGDF
jgi:hypothetical protein